MHSTNIKLLNIDVITTDTQQLTVETVNNYYITITENIETKDRNAYIQNKNTPDIKNIITSSQYVKEVKKLRNTTFQSKPTKLLKLKT